MKIFRSMAVAVAALSAVSTLSQNSVKFTSTDTILQKTFDWARDMAMSYVHDSSDPVGLWYEAALPGRDAFCMRDVSHQVVGAAILGLDEYNLNMLAKIASNISESKDWCSYWEIDKLDRPAPCDFGNDKEFWYNLPANFDVMRACKLVYDWTGDSAYLSSPEFVNFYERTAHDYADRWNLTPDSIMGRQRFMNTPEPFDRKKGFHTCRGLPSYAENFSGITVAIDLLGAIMTGYEAYADMCELEGRDKEAAFGRQRAKSFGEMIETQWWDSSNSRYNTFFTADGEFHRGEGIPYLLLIGALRNPDRTSAAVADVLSRTWNVENMSAFPAFLYDLGYADDAYRILNSLPAVDRNDYPEVSYGAIEGVIGGVMGVKPDASKGKVATCYRPADQQSVSIAKDIPFNGGLITVEHNGVGSTTFTNNTSKPITWEASFVGEGTVANKGKKLPTLRHKDVAGKQISTASVEVKPGKTVTLKIK